jgi:hypothetical protein
VRRTLAPQRIHVLLSDSGAKKRSRSAFRSSAKAHRERDGRGPRGSRPFFLRGCTAAVLYSSYGPSAYRRRRLPVARARGMWSRVGQPRHAMVRGAVLRAHRAGAPFSRLAPEAPTPGCAREGAGGASSAMHGRCTASRTPWCRDRSLPGAPYPTGLRTVRSRAEPRRESLPDQSPSKRPFPRGELPRPRPR